MRYETGRFHTRQLVKAAFTVGAAFHLCTVYAPVGAQNAAVRRAPPAVVSRASGAVATGAPTLRAVKPDSPGALVIEITGGSVGSLAAIRLVKLVAKCGEEDLGCIILKVGAGGAAGAVGATVGTTFAANYTGSSRSVLGAAAGAVVGTGAGLGIHYMLNRASDRNLGDDVVVPIFVLSQGTFAALGSRLIGSARRMR